jgi:hypothetical protein
MRKSIIAAGLASVIAASSFAGTAMADPYYWHHRQWHHHDDNGGAFAAGAIFGIIGGALAANAYHDPYYGYQRPYYGGSAHTRWCEQRYRTYDPSTDMFYAQPGVRQYCHSPYD